MASTILGCLALIFGTVILLVMWRNKIGDTMTGLLALAALAYGLISAPAGIVYWFRRSRGEATEFFDYEIVEPGEEPHEAGVDDAPDHR
jgi:amino acid permease